MIRELLATILFFGSIAVSGAAQQINNTRLDPVKPTVYLTFEHPGENGLVWLRLRNNSHWAISFRTENQAAIVVPWRLSDGRLVNALADGLPVTPEYVIENVTDHGRAESWCTSAHSWLAPGVSAIFSIPREYMKPVGRLKISFTYEWEGPGKEPEHRVDFCEFELENALTQISR